MRKPQAPSLGRGLPPSFLDVVQAWLERPDTKTEKAVAYLIIFMALAYFLGALARM